MAVQLGETTDPRALIPGQPESIADDLRQLVGNIDLVGGAGDGLRGVDPREWTGEGANSFRDAFGAAIPEWFQAVDFLGQSGETLADFGDTLTWAQGEAQRAIELFTEAQAASRTALEQFTGLARQAMELGQSIGMFQDPGAGLAQEAQSILDAAREAVASTGDSVARAFGVGGDGASIATMFGNFAAMAFGMDSDGEGGYSTDLPGGGAWGADNRQTERVFNPETGEYEDVDPGGWQQDGINRSYANQFGDPDADLVDLQAIAEAAGIDVTEVGWEREAAAALREGSIDGEFDNGTVSGSGGLSGSVLSASAGASGTASWLGASGAAHAEAYLAQGHAEGELNFGEHAGVSGSADAMVGAEASAEGNISWTGAEGSVEAFAGAKAGGDVSAEAGGLGAGANGEVWVGVGVEASGQFGMGEDGKFHIGASAGAALGVGASAGFDVSVDPAEVVDTVADVSDDVADVAGDAWDAAGDAWDAAGDWL
ncbi:putative T7SS-secreted protein [Amycolatopsis sp. NPDC049868]|uniref:putative T7SS-secreted protein n=1 Tax=Amycolatopsis sp. NPDC049868 TaxID=3363934 RepID=UPI0037A1F20D